MYHKVLSLSVFLEVLLYLYVLILQMCGGGWRKSICVLIVVYVTFRLGSATTCTSQCKSHARIDVVSVGQYDNTVDCQLSGHNRTIRWPV